MDKNGQGGNQRDRPRLRNRLAAWFRRWGSDLLLSLGALLLSVGMGCVYFPAGLIAAGMLLIAGGVLAAKGDGEA